VTISRPLDEIKPVSLVGQADKTPTTKDLARLLFRGPVSGSSNGPQEPDCFKVEEAGGNRFRVLLKAPIYTPAGYLELSQPVVPDFDVLRKALERPYARMDVDYQRPYEPPLPHFVRMRAVAQMLSQRAQCYLLLGQPEAAWHELALVRDMCRLLEAKPAGDCPTLVAAMIDVATTGLYTSVIQDGFRLGVWREPELAAMQKQLGTINFLPLLQRAFEVERGAVCRAFEQAPLPKDLSAFWSMPRGWLYQNMCAVARLDQLSIDVFDVPNNRVLARRADENQTRLEAAFKRRTPYTILAAIAVPNLVRASQVMARTQSLANEAYLACGLERYRLAHGQYPETLAALVPQFADKLPHDIIGGEPLKYHRASDGEFVLYSVGWNERDDGGVPGKRMTEGDWIWQ